MAKAWRCRPLALTDRSCLRLLMSSWTLEMAFDDILLISSWTCFCSFTNFLQRNWEKKEITCRWHKSSLTDMPNYQNMLSKCYYSNYMYASGILHRMGEILVTSPDKIWVGSYCCIQPNKHLIKITHQYLLKIFNILTNNWGQVLIF